MLENRGEGYTILETLIVLGVSAVMFIFAVIAFGGRQQQVQFSQGVQDFNSVLQDIINDVSTGFFDNPGNLTCTLGSIDFYEAPAITPVGTNPQGTSEDCVFIGRVVQFRPSDPTPPLEQLSTYRVYDLVGRRENLPDASADEVPEELVPAEDLQHARPIAVEYTTKDFQVDWGIRITDVTHEPTGADYGAMGFFTSFASTFGGLEATDISNNQAVRYGFIEGSTLDQGKGAMMALLNRITDNPTEAFTQADLDGSATLLVCLQNPEKNHRAAIQIGVEGVSTTEVQFDFYNEAICSSTP